MAEQTGIGWCDATFNPWIGCSKVSPGCAHCYAETFSANRMGLRVWGDDAPRRVTADATWRKPLRWTRLAREGHLPNGDENLDGHRPRVFCASMSDVFEERAELDEHRNRLFELIRETPELDWLILTKRPERALAWFESRRRDPLWFPIPPNVWMGVSIENARFTWRADVLREIPAAVRFISAEPLLGSLFDRANDRRAANPSPDEARYIRSPLNLEGIGWVIVGGESGPGARPFHLEHAREIIRNARCPDPACNGPHPSGACERGHSAGCDAESRPAVFVKQLGKHPTATWEHDGQRSCRQFGINHPKGENWEEWPADLRIREFPRSVA